MATIYCVRYYARGSRNRIGGGGGYFFEILIEALDKLSRLVKYRALVGGKISICSMGSTSPLV